MWKFSKPFLCRGYTAAFSFILVAPAALMSAQRDPVDLVGARSQSKQMGTQPGGYYGQQPAVESIDLTKYELIRDEGMNHGKVIEFASALCDGIGPRLTGSPNMKKANEWARDTLTKIGLANAHLEDWGEFGMGWYQVSTWGRLVTPEPEPIWMEAAVWSPSTDGPVSGEIVYLPLADASELDAIKGTLRGKIVLLGAPRANTDLDQPLSFRYTEEELEELRGSRRPPPSRRTAAL